MPQMAYLATKNNNNSNIKKEFLCPTLRWQGKRKNIFTFVVIIICNKNKKVNQLYKKRIPLSNYITAMEKEKIFFTLIYSIGICNRN